MSCTTRTGLLNAQEISDILSAHDDIFITGLDYSKQRQVVTTMAEDIYKASLETGKAAPKVVQSVISNIVNSIESNLTSLNETKTTLEAINEDGSMSDNIAYIEESGKDNELALRNIDKLSSMAMSALESFSGVTVKRMDSLPDQKNDLDTENEAGLERTTFSDSYQLELNSRDTTSSRLKKFLAFVNDHEFDEDGNTIPKKNFIGTNVSLNFEYVYNELHRLLEGIEATESAVLTRLNTIVEEEVKQNKMDNLAWLPSFVSYFNSSPSHIRREFVSDMAKHKTNMGFIMYDNYYDEKDQTYVTKLRVNEDNSNSTARRIYSKWRKNHKSSSVVVNGLYSGEVKDELLESLATIRVSKNSNEQSRLLKSTLQKLGVIPHPDYIDSLFLFGNRVYYGNDSVTTGPGLASVGGILETIINSIPVDKSIDSIDLLNDSLFLGLARGSAKYSKDEFSNSFRVGDKTIYTYTNNHYLSNRVRDLKNKPDLISKLQGAQFVKDSFYLELLANEDTGFKEWFDINYVSINPLKHKNKNKRSGKTTEMSPLDMEVVKVGLFNSGRKYEPIEINNQTYQARKSQFFFPTNSDKSRIMNGKGYAISAAQRTRVTSKGKTVMRTNYTRQSIDLIYDSVIQPEIDRIFNTSQPSFDNNSDMLTYNGKLFYMFPSLNDLKITYKDTKEVRPLLDIVSSTTTLDANTIDSIRNQIEKDLIRMANNKLKSWAELGILEDAGANNKSKYIERIKGIEDRTQTVKETALDFVYNYALFNANMFQLVTGDPAQYFKKNIAGTADNMFKRLSAEIAPGIEMEGEDYIQLYAYDRESASTHIEYLTKLLGDKAKPYTEIEGTDAQEYTTWKEHLNTLRDLGRLTNEEHVAASKAFSEGRNPSKKVFDKVLQPLKPVYVNNEVTEVGEIEIDRKTYIKSSSFPLIPTLTRGLELDKLRIKLEDIESKSGKGVRLAYKTATKVGFPKSALTIFDEQGNITDFNVDSTYWNKYINKRTGLRIQQDIPYDAKKSTVNKGSQESKLLWANVLNEDFVYEGSKYKGTELYDVYVNTYRELYQYGLDNLRSRFKDRNNATDLAMVSSLLKQELRNSGETSKPILDGLDVEDKTFIERGKSVIRKDFKVPLWLSPYADKYMALLSSLVKNNVVSQKLTGKSFVLGSNEGFKTWEAVKEEGITPGIVFSDKFTGELQPQHVDNDGVVQPAQILIPFKFRDKDGNLLKVENFTTKDGRIDNSKLPNDILKSFGFRIPTQLHSSMSYMEIVGFLPSTSGDLIIAPREFTKQMGSDFDVDKLYSYLYHTQYDSGKGLTKTKGVDNYGEKVSELKSSIKSARVAIASETGQAEAIYSYIANKLSEVKITGETINTTQFAEHVSSLYPEVTPSYIKDLVTSKIDLDKLNKDYVGGLHNKLLDIHMSVVSANNSIQKSIAEPLGFGEYLDNTITYKEKDYLGGYADLISVLSGEDQKSSMIIDEAYQTEKFYDGTAGKDGISMFSSDSIFNVLAQDKGLVVNEYVDVDGKSFKRPISVSFGNKYNTSDGSLSDLKTLKKKEPRLKTEVIAAAQNLSVDNANEQGMFKVNMNTFTFGVYSILNFLGFEEDISAPFMSQPIIKDYVKKMQQSKSILKSYVPNIEREIVDELKMKYLDGKVLSDNDLGLADFNSKNASVELLKMIESPETYPDFGLTQAAIIEKFIWLKEQERKVAPLQQYLNIDSKGFHKNMYFNVMRNNNLQDFDENIITNADKLFGEYTSIPLGEGLRQVSIEPTTLAGLDNIYGTKELINTFGHFFIESNPLLGFNSLINTIAINTSVSGQLSVKEVNDVRESYRSYLMSNFNVDNIQNLRKELFTNKEKGSLYDNLDKLKSTGYWNQNIFLNSLEINYTDGILSIDYNNAGGDIFDETNVYMSFLDMFRQNSEINGVIPAVVAEDLIKYAILRGDNKAKQFIKLVPPEIISKLISIPTGLNIGKENIFIDQFYRHNVGKLPVVENYSEVNSSTIKLTDVDSYPKYIKIENEEGNKIFKQDLTTGLYKRIGKLGSPEFTEYSITPNNTSILKSNNVKEAPVESIPSGDIVNYKLQDEGPGGIEVTTEVADVTQYKIQDVKDNLDFNTPDTLLDSIINLDKYPDLTSLAEVIKDVIPKGLKVSIVDSSKMSYNSDTNTLIYGNERMETLTNKDLVTAILHEFMHSVTSNAINRYNEGTQFNNEITGAINRITSYKNSIINDLNKEHTNKFKNTTLYYLQTAKDNKLQSILNDQTVHIQVKDWAQLVLNYRQDPTIDEDGSIKDMLETANIQATEYNKNELVAYYSLLNSKEFVVISSTDKAVMDIVNNFTTNTYTNKIKEFFNSILEALGLTTDTSKALVSDILTIAGITDTSTNEVTIKSIVDRNSEENAIFKYTDSNHYFMEGDNIYFITRPTKPVFTQPGINRNSFVSAYIKELENVIEYSLNELEDSYPRSFVIDGTRYDSVKAFDGVDTYEATLESFKQNPKFVAKLFKAYQDESNLSKKYTQLYTDLKAEFGFAEPVVIATTSPITKGYSKYNLPDIQTNPVDLDVKAAKYADKMIGDNTESVEAFNSTYDSMFSSLEQEGEEIKKKCKGTKKAAKGLKTADFKKGSTWTLVKDLKGLPSHAKGGVNLRIENNKTVFNTKQGTIEAKHGLRIPYKKAEPVIEQAITKRKLRKKLSGPWTPIKYDKAKVYAEYGAVLPRNKKNTDFTKGSIWSMVKDLKGFPSHNKGGIDIFVDDNNNVMLNKEGAKIQAKCGCVLKGDKTYTPETKLTTNKFGR